MDESAVFGHGEQGCVAAPRVEAEGGDAARDLALVEPVVLEILEQVAGEAELGGRDGAPARELERERRLAGVEHEPVEFRQRGRLARRLQRRGLAACDDGELDGSIELEPLDTLELADLAPAL